MITISTLTCTLQYVETIFIYKLLEYFRNNYIESARNFEVEKFK